ncbi:hypothetical protein B0H19DRAFT_436909 [Mycena capillaripes]|nr:hypothetical protein B0H19DRAFT_436909 [Mycena capillaripes]
MFWDLLLIISFLLWAGTLYEITSLLQELEIVTFLLFLSCCAFGFVWGLSAHFVVITITEANIAFWAQFLALYCLFSTPALYDIIFSLDDLDTIALLLFLNYCAFGFVSGVLVHFLVHVNRIRPSERLSRLQAEITSIDEFLTSQRDEHNRVEWTNEEHILLEAKLLASDIANLLLEMHDAPWKTYFENRTEILRSIDKCEKEVIKLKARMLLPIEVEHQKGEIRGAQALTEAERRPQLTEGIANRSSVVSKPNQGSGDLETSRTPLKTQVRTLRPLNNMYDQRAASLTERPSPRSWNLSSSLHPTSARSNHGDPAHLERPGSRNVHGIPKRMKNSILLINRKLFIIDFPAESKMPHSPQQTWLTTTAI